MTLHLHHPWLMGIAIFVAIALASGVAHSDELAAEAKAKEDRRLAKEAAARQKLMIPHGFVKIAGQALTPHLVFSEYTATNPIPIGGWISYVVGMSRTSEEGKKENHFMD